MNSLSWFIYLADVLPNFAWMGQVSFFFLLFGSIATVAVFVIANTEGSGNKDERAVVNKVCRGITVKILLPLSLLMLVTNLIPSKETIYLIAGSEAGEAVVVSEEGKEILSDIHEVIKFQLKSLKGESDGDS